METGLAAAGQRSPLHGRAGECGRLDGLLADVRRGESRSLVLRGEAGIGKTALLEYLTQSASGVTVLRAVGVESEMELAFATVHQLCAPLLDRMESISQTDWGQGSYARCRALLSDGQDAEDSYNEAVSRLSRTRLRPDLARAHLLYGEWLRRERRRAEARAQLRTAYEMFDAIGMEAFAARARRELRATGETARTRAATLHGELSPQEAQIARLARAGLSNPEIAAQLFLSPRTVQYHLGNIFDKLKITSRRQLRQALPGSGGPDGPMADHPRDGQHR